MVKPSARVLSADKSPPPCIPPDVLIALELETAVMPKVKAPVTLL